MDMIARLRSHEPLELTPENIEEVYRTTRYMCSFDDWGGLEACVLRQRERAHETGQWLDETCLEMFLVARAVPLCTISAERFVTPMPGIDQKASRDRKARLIQACAIVVNELILEWRRAHLFRSTVMQNGSAIDIEYSFISYGKYRLLSRRQGQVRSRRVRPQVVEPREDDRGQRDDDSVISV